MQLGEQRGIEKGRARRDIEIIENMLSQEIDIDIIARSMGRTIEQIEKIKNEVSQVACI